MKKKLFKVLCVTLLIISTISLSACGSQSGSSSKLAQIKKAGKLVVGTSADYPPYEFHKQVNGKDEIVGFDIEIAKQIAKDMGVKLELKEIEFKGLLEALQAGKIDMVIAGMNPTEERAKQVDFSKRYYTAVQSIIIRKEDQDKIKSIADLKGKQVGVQLSTTQEDIAKDQITGGKIKSLDLVTNLILELKSKKVDAVVLENPVAVAYASKNSDLVVSSATFSKDSEKGSAVAVKKNSGDFITQINKTLDKLMSNKSIDQYIKDASNMID